MATEISAYAGMSNTLSTADGIFVTIFIAYPLCNFLYKKLEPIIGRNTEASIIEEDSNEGANNMKKLNLETFIELVIIMLLVSITGLFGNFVGYKVSISESIPGMLILFAIALVGTLLTYIIPIKNCPAIIYISIIGVLIACPISRLLIL